MTPLVSWAEVRALLLDLLAIPSPSRREAALAARCEQELAACGFRVVRDGAGQHLKGETGNLVATLPGRPDRPPLLLSAHLDTVAAAAASIPTLTDDGRVYSGNGQPLGADDKAGVAVVLLAARRLAHRRGKMGTLQVVLTVAEELGMLGARYLDRSLLQARAGLVLDAPGPAGTLVTSGPSHTAWQLSLQPRAVWGTATPTSAARLAAQGLTEWRKRLPADCVLATHEFAGDGERLRVSGELRCRSDFLLEQARAAAVAAFAAVAAGRWQCKWQWQCLCPAYDLPTNHMLCRTVASAVQSAGLTPRWARAEAGCDANVFAGYGIPCVNLAVGCQHMHTSRETVHLADVAACTHAVVHFCTDAAWYLPGGLG
ncbi:MAG: M20/M25/M40 family metallo-hydrolase [Alicyclobacillus sp.]|nr:M20/M25/M40 family metallo-hydrolase [Alicyclobacillus sp.]